MRNVDVRLSTKKTEPGYWAHNVGAEYIKMYADAVSWRWTGKTRLSSVMICCMQCHKKSKSTDFSFLAMEVSDVLISLFSCRISFELWSMSLLASAVSNSLAVGVFYQEPPWVCSTWRRTALALRNMTFWFLFANMLVVFFGNFWSPPSLSPTFINVFGTFYKNSCLKNHKGPDEKRAGFTRLPGQTEDSPEHAVCRWA